MKPTTVQRRFAAAAAAAVPFIAAAAAVWGMEFTCIRVSVCVCVHCLKKCFQSFLPSFSILLLLLSFPLVYT